MTAPMTKTLLEELEAILRYEADAEDLVFGRRDELRRALENDARYRWLRDKRISGEGLPHLGTIYEGEECSYDHRSGAAIDAAIDAARKDRSDD